MCFFEVVGGVGCVFFVGFCCVCLGGLCVGFGWGGWCGVCCVVGFIVDGIVLFLGCVVGL